MTKRKNNTKYNKSWVTWFNKNKTKELYDDVLNEKLPNHKKCICCDGPIYYYDSIFSIDKNYNIYPNKKSYLTKKSLLENDYYLSICEDCLIKKYPEYNNLNKSRVFNRICDITCFAFNIPNDISEKWKKQNYSITEKNLISKHGEKNGKEKWKTYCEKQSLTNTFEYKKEKYGWDEKKFNEYNRSRSVTLKNIIKKNGEEKGLEIWNNYIDRQRYTCSLEYFIEKYGEVSGLEKFDNFVKKRSFEFGYSDISQQLFDELKNNLTNYTLFYATNNKEYYFVDTINHITYMTDLFIKELNLVVEFNGDKWHANPEIYSDNDIPIPFLKKQNRPYLAKDIWKKDANKIKFIKTKVTDVIIIWEKDLKEKGMVIIVNELIEKIKKLKNDGK